MNTYLQKLSKPAAKNKTTVGSSGPSSLTTGALPSSYRRASEGGANLYVKGAKNKIEPGHEKNNEI